VGREPATGAQRSGPTADDLAQTRVTTPEQQGRDGLPAPVDTVPTSSAATTLAIPASDAVQSTPAVAGRVDDPAPQSGISQGDDTAEPVDQSDRATTAGPAGGQQVATVPAPTAAGQSTPDDTGTAGPDTGTAAVPDGDPRSSMTIEAATVPFTCPGGGIHWLVVSASDATAQVDGTAWPAAGELRPQGRTSAESSWRYTLVLTGGRGSPSSAPTPWTPQPMRAPLPAPVSPSGASTGGACSSAGSAGGAAHGIPAANLDPSWMPSPARGAVLTSGADDCVVGRAEEPGSRPG
jgi:hypothetical protein